MLRALRVTARVVLWPRDLPGKPPWAPLASAIGPTGAAGSLREVTRTPLAFARDAVVVAVHPDVGAVSQEERRFGARRHLRAMGPAVADEGAGGLVAVGHGQIRSIRNTTRVLAVPERSESDQDQQRRNARKDARLVTAADSRGSGSTVDCRAARAKHVSGSLLSSRVGLDLEGESFADSRSAAVSWKGRDVNEYFGAALGRRDEPETSIVIPPGELAFEAHLETTDSSAGDPECRPDSADAARLLSPPSDRLSVRLRSACARLKPDPGDRYADRSITGLCRAAPNLS